MVYQTKTGGSWYYDVQIDHKIVCQKSNGNDDFFRKILLIGHLMNDDGPEDE